MIRSTFSLLLIWQVTFWLGPLIGETIINVFAISILVDGNLLNPEISICIPVVYGDHIKESLDSIFANKYDDYEVLVNDSSKFFNASDLLSEYDVKIIKKKTRSFESRFVTINESKGNNVLLFDETRVMSKTLLGSLSSMKKEIVVIGERDIGKGIITFLSNLDKRIVPNDAKLINPFKNKSIIPRFYNRNIIRKAMDEISKNLSLILIKEIVGLDLELIYFESYKISQNSGIIPTPEINHYGDSNFQEVFRKYFRYGKSQKMLRNSYYADFAGLSGRNRANASPKDWAMSLPLQIIRGIPFLLGYLSGSAD